MYSPNEDSITIELALVNGDDDASPEMERKSSSNSSKQGQASMDLYIQSLFAAKYVVSDAGTEHASSPMPSFTSDNHRSHVASPRRCSLASRRTKSDASRQHRRRSNFPRRAEYRKQLSDSQLVLNKDRWGTSSPLRSCQKSDKAPTLRRGSLD
mmetsp:Transcript_1802/g.3803  ORF Transcript_1802/g.3803 Transcript_1802/m.3803 type:complete len:154 (+) Transcript_1802:280-741(+)